MQQAADQRSGRRCTQAGVVAAGVEAGVGVEVGVEVGMVEAIWHGAKGPVDDRVIKLQAEADRMLIDRLRMDQAVEGPAWSLRRCNHLQNASRARSGNIRFIQTSKIKFISTGTARE